jgi:BirA family transcriptional regulator, biotin operon repressor / biotin---[acetyl-CoA-carboxylase] ligase
MDQPSLISALAGMGFPHIRYFDRLDSTNDEAWRWVEAGASHLALVVADEQTAGRGRVGRHWVTPPGAALAFSLVLLPPALNPGLLPRLTPLGALAVHSVLERIYHLPALVKWPNDVLVGGSKVAGVLVETRWSGEKLAAAIIGIGINIAPESVSAASLSPAGLNFPATCLELELKQPVDRLECLGAILYELTHTWLPRLPLSEFIQQWEARLAYRHQWVELRSENSPAGDGSAGVVIGKLVGLTQDGALQLATRDGSRMVVTSGELHLRPAGNASHNLPQD